MQTERFNSLRKKILNDIFSKWNIIEIWRNIVKDQLRDLDIKDLYDNYDFNYNIEERASVIRSEILNGNYKVSQPLIYRIEKKFGICRHLVMPQPMDSLVLQVLIENIAPNILKNQPSENAFYSRTKHRTAQPHEVDEYGLPWKEQWKKLQKKIYNFTEENELLVVTDLSNYYDSIDIYQLRKVFTSYAKIDEVLVDLLFRLVEEISWKPDYLPYSGKGLPTTNIEGIRLLAHCFLFELDAVIKEKSKNSFTRWMDDLVIGFNTRKEAIETISSISDVLKSRGLSLNLSKTNIYNSSEGFNHFQIDENRFIDDILNNIEESSEFNDLSKTLVKKFKQHLKNQGPKYWDKVAKRYILLFGKFKSSKILNQISVLYIAYPVLRPSLIIYLSQLGYSRKTSDCILDILNCIDIFDDISLYQICHLITEWEIPINEHSKKFLNLFEGKLISFSKNKKIPFHFYCILWFKAKYSHQDEIITFLEKYENIWQLNSFLRRQATAVLSRLFFSKKAKIILQTQVSSGILNTVTLANQILKFTTLKQLDKKLNAYLFPKNLSRPYSLSRFLVLCSVLNSYTIKENEIIKERVKKQITDPYYLKWLDAQYNIS